MRARGAVVLALVAFILLMAFASYLLDIPMAVVLIGASFAIGVILWIASRTKPAARVDTVASPRDAMKVPETDGE